MVPGEVEIVRDLRHGGLRPVCHCALIALLMTRRLRHREAAKPVRAVPQFGEAAAARAIAPISASTDNPTDPNHPFNRAR